MRRRAAVWTVYAAVWAVYAAMLAAAAPEDVFQAIRDNRLSTLAEADRAARDRRGNTPLLYAAGFGSTEAVRILLEGGAGVDAKNGFDATALIWAAASPAKARLLIAHGADVNARTRQGRTPLMIAAACDGCSEIVKLLLEKGADPKARNAGGGTALEIAADSGDSESVRLLLAAGAEPDLPDGAGGTPLMHAVLNCSLPSIRLLLARGANVNARTTDGGTVKFGPIQLIHLTPLALSTAYCPSEVVKTLVDAGAEVNARDGRGMTPLMLGVASETQDAAIVRLLVHAGADVNAKSTAGETAMDWAQKYGDADVISMLKAEGAHQAARYAAPKRPDVAPKTARAAVASATALLERSATGFFHQSGCVGCHHQSMSLLAVNAARTAGVPIDETAAKELGQMIVAEFASAQDLRMQRFDPGGGADGQGYAMLALDGAGYLADAATDTIAVHTAAMQHRAGNWHVGDASRAPIQESEIARTARAMRTLQRYGPPALRSEFDARIARARDWLLQARAKTNDDLAMQLAGLEWAAAARDRIQALGRTLVAAQREDGGWAQNANLASDAYATGESLWALGECGIARPADAAYQRGVKFLLATQWPDGSWYVRSRAPKFQPYFQSGFPFEHDQWISSAATAWAVMALAPAIENEKRASR